MSVQPELPTEAGRWMAGARRELLAARRLAPDPLLAGVACYHAHLAAEKSLKALLVLHEKPVPRIHSLIKLRRLLPIDVAERFDLEQLAALDPWAVEGRYPDDLARTTPTVAECVIGQADECLHATEHLLREHGEED